MARAKTTARRDGDDAIALLKADHRQVEAWFEQFEKARTTARKLEIAARICNALTVHMTIEEETFYPAFILATKDADLHHEAVIEHDAARKLLAEVEASSPEDEYYDARVKVLSEMIKHHVKEEEQAGGMFAEARKSRLDLHALGAEMAARKGELEAQQVAIPANKRRGANGSLLTRIIEAGSR
jgi:hemerythrin superfamily protein